MGDQGLHFRSPFVAQGGKGLFRHGPEGISLVLNPSDGRDMRPHRDPPGFQILQADAAGHAQRRGQPAGKVAAARHILISVVLHGRRIVRVPRPGNLPQPVIILAASVRVPDHRRHRGAAGNIPHQSGEKFRFIRFLPRGGPGVISRSAPGQESPQRVLIHPESGRKSLHRHTDGRGMGLTENRQPKVLPQGRAHSAHLLCSFFGPRPVRRAQPSSSSFRRFPSSSRRIRSSRSPWARSSR